MNSSKILVLGYVLLITGILFLASSLAGFVMMIVYLFYTITSIDGNFEYLFLPLLGLFWCVSHFFIGKDLVRKGKSIVSNAEEISKNPWLEPTYHISTLKNLSGRRFRGYVMITIGIFVYTLFGIGCLAIVFNIANVFLLKISATSYFSAVSVLFGFLLLPINFLLGGILTSRGNQLALIDQTNNFRSPSFYLNYAKHITFKRLLGYIICIIGFLFVLMSSISAILAIPFGYKAKLLIYDQLGTFGYFVGGWILAAAYIFIGRYILRKGKQFSVLSGEELLIIDKRPPVLYLRSFWNDDEMDKIPTQNVEVVSTFSLWGSTIFKPIRNQEELLAKQLKRIGPPIAVGMPNEELPRLGMARLHFNDDEWREKVTELINTSALVIMLAGFTANFWWELETSVRNIDPKKLIILLPFETQSQSIIGVDDNVNGYSLFKKKAEIILPKQLPNFAGTVIPGSNLSGLVWFDSDWNPKVYEFCQTGKSLKKTLVHVLNYY